MDKGAEIYMECIEALQNRQYSRSQNGTGHEHPISPSFNLPEQFNGMHLLNSPLPFPNRPPFITPSIPSWSQYNFQYPLSSLHSLHRYGSYQYLEQMQNRHRYVSNELPAYRNEQFDNKPKMWHPWLNCDQQAGTTECKNNDGMISSPNAFELKESLSGLQSNNAEYVIDHEHKKTQPTNKKFKKCNNDRVPRPMNSFMLFAKRNRSQIHLVFPQCDNRAVSKILSETWYSLDPRIRKPYVDLAKDMKNKHFQLHPEFKWKAKHNIEVNSHGEIIDTQYSPEQNIPHEEDVTNHGIFQLAPTPAQLGIRRKQALADVPTNIDSLKPSKEQHESEFEPIDIEKNNSLVDLYFQDRFTTLPLVDFSNYKSQGQNNLSPKFLSSTVQYESNKKRFGTTKRVAKVKLSKQMSKSLVGSRFFGPDFNIDNIKDMSDQHMSLSKTPRTSEIYESDFRSEKPRECREIFKQRRRVVEDMFERYGIFPREAQVDNLLREYKHLFGSKSFLKEKIREYRQQYMHEKYNQPKTG